VQDSLQVISALACLVIMVNVPDSVQAWGVKLASLENMIVLSGQNETSDQEFLVLVGIDLSTSGIDLILDMQQLFESVVVTGGVSLENRRTSLAEEFETVVVLVQEIILTVVKVVQDWETLNKVLS
jgi:hypothetical protein